MADTNDSFLSEKNDPLQLTTPALTLHTKAMAAMPQSPNGSHLEVQSSLEDSTYDLLSDVSSQISDDDGRTTSIASTDDHCATPEEDELTALSSSQVLGPEESIYTHHEEEDRNHESLQESMIGASVDSEMTTRALSEPTIPSAAASIMETRPSGEQTGYTVVVHRIRTFDEKSMPETLQIFEKPEITASAEYSLSKDFLGTSEKPFNVLFLGDHTRNDAILEKLGSALALSTPRKTSRKHIVQVGDFGGSSPKVELLDTFGPDIVPQTCKNILKPGGSSILLALDDDRLVKLSPKASKSVLRSPFGAGYVPDLIVISYTRDTFEDRTSRDAQGFYGKLKAARDILKNAGFPILDISAVSPLEHHQSFGLFDSRSLRMKFTAPDEVTDEPVVISETPVGQHFFLSMDSSLLNRHLNCILGEPKQQPKRDYLHESVLFFQDARQHTKTAGAVLKKGLSPSNVKNTVATRIEDARHLDVESFVKLTKTLAVFVLLATSIWIGMAGSSIGPKGETAVQSSNRTGTVDAVTTLLSQVATPIATTDRPVVDHAALSDIASSMTSTKAELSAPTNEKAELKKSHEWSPFMRSFEKKSFLDRIQVTSNNKSQIVIHNANLIPRNKATIHMQPVGWIPGDSDSPIQQYGALDPNGDLIMQLHVCFAHGAINVTVEDRSRRQIEVKSWEVDFGYPLSGAVECFLDSLRTAFNPKSKSRPDQQAILEAKRRAEKKAEDFEIWAKECEDRLVRFEKDLQDRVARFGKGLSNRVAHIARPLSSISETKYVKRARLNGSNLIKKVRRVGSKRMEAIRERIAREDVQRRQAHERRRALKQLRREKLQAFRERA